MFHSFSVSTGCFGFFPAKCVAPALARAWARFKLVMDGTAPNIQLQPTAPETVPHQRILESVIKQCTKIFPFQMNFKQEYQLKNAELT